MIGLHNTASQTPTHQGGARGARRTGAPRATGQGPQRLHPLAMEGYQRYFKGKRGFSPQDKEALRSGMIKLTDSPKTLWSAISGFGLLAILLEQEGDKQSAGMIRDLIATGGRHLAPIAGAVSKALGIETSAARAADQSARAAQQLLMQTSTMMRAPVHDAQAPAGTLPLFAVDYAMVSSRFREIRLVQNARWRAHFPALAK